MSTNIFVRCWKIAQHGRAAVTASTATAAIAVWSLAQIALASVAYELEKTNHHIKIYCTIRHEAFLKMPEVESDAFQISGRCTKIEYTRDDLEKIFLKNIEITAKERLVEPDTPTRCYGWSARRISWSIIGLSRSRSPSLIIFCGTHCTGRAT